MNTWHIVLRREFSSLFATPLAYAFMLLFWLLAAIFTFHLGGFYESEQASLQVFFYYHPWLYLLLIPALAPRIWCEERRSGSIELLMTMGAHRRSLVAGKFLAMWLFAGLTLALTFPMVISVNYLGEPDSGAIFTGYLASWLLAGAFLAIASYTSILSKNSTTSFLLCLALSLLFVVSSQQALPQAISQWLPQWLLGLLDSIALPGRFHSLTLGLIDLRDLIFFASFILAWLAASLIALERHKARR